MAGVADLTMELPHLALKAERELTQLLELHFLQRAEELAVNRVARASTAALAELQRLSALTA